MFYELVGHRLAMGFQMVVPKETFTYMGRGATSSSSLEAAPASMGLASASGEFICDLNSSTSIVVKGSRKAIRGYYKLSLGRIYHELFYLDPDGGRGQDYVQVEIYMPKARAAPPAAREEEYWYRFQVSIQAMKCRPL